MSSSIVKTLWKNKDGTFTLKIRDRRDKDVRYNLNIVPKTESESKILNEVANEEAEQALGRLYKFCGIDQKDNNRNKKIRQGEAR